MTKDWEGFESPHEHKVPAEALEQPTNMVTIPLDKLEDMQRRLKRKEWQGLNKYEIIAIDNATNDLMDFARAIEAKLKEKNHE